MKSFLLFLTVLVSCSDSPSRIPSSVFNHLDPSYDVSKTHKIYSGPGVMASDYPIARSLEKSKLVVKLNSLPSGVSCKKGELGSYSQKTTYFLGSNTDGFTDAIYCKLTHDGSDFPIYKSINVSYVIKNRTKEMLLELDNSYISYKDLLNEHENMTPSNKLFDYFDKNTISKELISWNSNENYSKSIDLEGKIIEIDSIIAEVKYKKGLFSSDTSSAEGIDVDDTHELIDPNFRAYEVLCKFGSDIIRASKLESKVLYSKSGKLNCFMNIYKKSLTKLKKFKGSVLINAKYTTNQSLKDLLEKSAETVSFAHKKRIETIWHEDKSTLNSMLRDVNGSFISASKRFEQRKKEIEHLKKLRKRDQFVDGLFPRSIDGNIGKGVSEYSLTPLEKKYFLPSGELTSKTYYLLSNKSHAFFKSNKLNFSFEYEAFADKVKIYLKTDEDHSGAEKVVNIKICDTYKRSLLNGLMTIQKDASVSKDDYLKLFSSFNIDDVSVCDVKDSESLAAQRGNQFYLVGNKYGSDKVNVYKTATHYKAQFNGVGIDEKLSSFGNHPAKGKSVSLNKYNNFEENSEVYLKMNIDQFATESGE